MQMEDYLKLMAEKDASDLFFSVGAPVSIKVDGRIEACDSSKLLPGHVKSLVYTVMDASQQAEFEQELELNFAISMNAIGRFRVNVFVQRNEVGVVVRYIKHDIPTVAELELPTVIESLALEKRGLILFVGATGSGKSTSLAAMVHHRNHQEAGHILTIEDPIEYLHRHGKSIVNQREVGIDTHSYAHALKNALREAPDVILIGEIRDRQTMQHALAYAETGHLCLSTLHANNANQALDRIINFFPESAHKQLLLDLSLNIQAIISQRLMPAVTGGRAVAVEVLLNSPYIADLIEKGKIDEIKEAMKRSKDVGMQTFDQALFCLVKAGKIAEEEALKQADSRNDLKLQLKIDSESDLSTGNDLSIKKDDYRDC